MRHHFPRRGALILGLALAATVAGCDRSRPGAEAPEHVAERAPDPRGDSTATAKLSIGTPAEPRPRARGRLPEPAGSFRAPRVAPEPRLSPALPSPAPAPVPEAASPAPEAVALEEKFEPPVLRQAGRLETPPGRKRGQIELELRVNEDGLVDEFRWVAGDADTLLLRAALDNVRVMRFDPARRGGKPVAAWCRRTFTFGGR